MNGSKRERPRVVVIGGGFGGLYAAKALRGAPVKLVLIDRRNHHLFQPLLYQVATAALNPSDIATPIRSILHRQKNAEVLLASVVGVDRGRKKVILQDGEVAYDFLIVATGATHSYFGHQEWSSQAPGLKTIEDALEIRRRVLIAYEAAERETDPKKKREWLTFVVIGAGPTGVELAGALSEISRHTLSRDFRNIDPREARVVLLEGVDRVLPPYPPRLSSKAETQLERLGVEVKTGRMVTAVDDRGITAGDERIPARTVLWAAGVQASPLGKALGVPLDKAGRVLVTRELTIPGDPSVFVVGDLAAVESKRGPVPGVAPAAMQEARRAADNIRRALAGRPMRAFEYRDKGSLATIGRAAGVADFGRVRLSGTVAWLSWLLVHIFFLIGFRNRLLVMIQWAWSYITYQRGARLITGLPEQQLPPIERPVNRSPDQR